MVHARVHPTAAAVRSHYDELDPVYRAVWGEHVHHGYWRTGRETPEEATDALVALVAERLQLAPRMKICDVGCGYGATARLLAERHGADVTGLTLSPVQAEVAAKAHPHVSCRVGDWLENDYADASFDRVYAIESTEHMADKGRFFSEAARVLRPGGRLAVCAWFAGPRAGAVATRFLLEPICDEGRLPSMGTRDDYAVMAHQAGLRMRSAEDLSANVRRTWTLCTTRVAKRLAHDAAFRRFAFARSTRNRDFLFSLPRMALALRTGAMHYELLVWEKPHGCW